MIHKAHARGSALYAKRSEHFIIMLKDGTTAPLRTEQQRLDPEGNVKLNPIPASAPRPATLQVKDFPVFYTPYIYFHDRRPPPVGFAELQQHQRHRLHPGHPVLLQPGAELRRHVYTRLHGQARHDAEGEFRYLTHSSGIVNAAYLNTRTITAKVPGLQQDRWLRGLKNTTGLDSRWLAESTTRGSVILLLPGSGY